MALVYFGFSVIEGVTAETTLQDILDAFGVESGFLRYKNDTRAIVTLPEEPLPDMTKEYELVVGFDDDYSREMKYLEAIRAVQDLGLGLDVASTDWAEYDPKCSVNSFATSSTILEYNPHNISHETLPYVLPGVPYAVKSFVSLGDDAFLEE
eukprot:PhF_6_TR7314/c0_g1_i1/m.10958